MTSKHLREVFGFARSPRVPSLLSLCLHSSTFNLPLFLSFYVPGFLHLCRGEPMFCLMQPVWIFFFSFFTNRAVSPAITTCATDLRATRADRLDYGLALAPCCYRSPDRVSWPGSILVSSNLVSALGTRLAPSVLAPWWLIQIQSIC